MSWIHLSKFNFQRKSTKYPLSQADNSTEEKDPGWGPPEFIKTPAKFSAPTFSMTVSTPFTSKRSATRYSDAGYSDLNSFSSCSDRATRIGLPPPCTLFARVHSHNPY